MLASLWFNLFPWQRNRLNTSHKIYFSLFCEKHCSLPSYFDLLVGALRWPRLNKFWGVLPISSVLRIFLRFWCLSSDLDRTHAKNYLILMTRFWAHFNSITRIFWEGVDCRGGEHLLGHKRNKSLEIILIGFYPFSWRSKGGSFAPDDPPLATPLQLAKLVF